MADEQDDAWLEQLREALASTADEDRTDERSAFTFGPSPAEAPPSAPARSIELRNPVREPLPGSVDGPPTAEDHRLGLAGVRDALRALGSRMTAVESLTEDIARQSRRANAGPDASMVEEIVTRVIRSELPAVLKEQLEALATPIVPTARVLGDETLDQWTAQAEHGEIPAGEVVLLAHELRARITQLEELQRQALEQLTADRRQLIDGAVAEIRQLLFGQ